MIDKISTMLKEYGLDENEIIVYVYLVRRKQLTAYKIAKDIRIHRSNCYNILDRLIAKGFVFASTIENKRVYSINELSKVLGRIKSKESILLSLAPEIAKLEAKEETFVKYIDTKNSFSEIDTKLYELAKDGKLTFAYMISNSPDLTTTNSRILIGRLLKDLSKAKSLESIDCRAIWDKKFKNNKFMKQFSKLGQNRFLDKLPNQATVFIYDNYVAFVFLNENDSFIEIRNNLVSQEMKAYFTYLWEIAKK
jgi:sugar-specific transcriptional regulator TrmB